MPSQGGKVLRIFDTRPDDLGEFAEEVGVGQGQSIATDERAAVPEPPFDSIVVEDSQDDGSFANPTSTG